MRSDCQSAAGVSFGGPFDQFHEQDTPGSAMTCRMSLICHGATSAVRLAAFPLDEELEDGLVIEPLQTGSPLMKASRAWTSPAPRARQTADALGVRCSEEVAL